MKSYKNYKEPLLNVQVITVTNCAVTSTFSETEGTETMTVSGTYEEL